MLIPTLVEVGMRDDVRAALSTLARAIGAEESPTIADLWKMFVDAKKTTLRAWKTEVGRAAHVLAFFGKMRANEISPAVVDQYRADRRVAMTARKKLTTPATRNREVEILQRVLNFAVRRKVLTENPVRGLEPEPEDNIREVVLTEAQIRALVSRCGSLVLRAFVLTGYGSGMRIGEVARLRWHQVNFEAGLIELSHRQTKTRRSRVTILSDDAAEALRLLPRVSDFVFANPVTGKHYSHWWMREQFNRAIELARLHGPDGERIWFHDLRRSFTTLSRRRGVDESVVMLMTGHTTRKTFERYNIVGREDIVHAREVIHRALASERKTPRSATTTLTDSDDSSTRESAQARHGKR